METPRVTVIQSFRCPNCFGPARQLGTKHGRLIFRCSVADCRHEFLHATPTKIIYHDAARKPKGFKPWQP